MPAAECWKLAPDRDIVTWPTAPALAICGAEGARCGRPSAPLARALGPTTRHSAKMLHPGAIPCWKLFAPYLPTLAAVPRLVFIDSDLLLLESPSGLWAHFDAFSPRHLLGLALNHDGIDQPRQP